MSAAAAILLLFISAVEVDCRAFGTGMDNLSCEPKIWQDDGRGGKIFIDNPEYMCDILCNDEEWDELSCVPKIWQSDGMDGQIFIDNPKYKGEKLCNDTKEVDWEQLEQCLSEGRVLSDIDGQCHHLATR